MRVESIALVMPQSAWAFLLQWHKVKDLWMLPLEMTADPIEGSAWLIEQGLLMIHDNKAVLDSSLERLGLQLALAERALDIKAGSEICSLAHTPSGWLWIQPLDSCRLSIVRAEHPLSRLCGWTNGRDAIYGIKESAGQRWLSHMTWAQAEFLLRELIGKE